MRWKFGLVQNAKGYYVYYVDVKIHVSDVEDPFVTHAFQCTIRVHASP